MDVLRPRAKGLQAAATALALAHAPLIFAVLRNIRPICRIPGGFIVTRYDDVREVLLNDRDFTVPYADNIHFILHEPPFVLGMADSPEYRGQLAAMRRVMLLPGDIEALADQAAILAAARIAGAGGRIDVVDFSRRVIFDVMCGYFGIAQPANDELLLWVTRLFIFQLTYDGTDAGLHRDAAEMAPRLRRHIEAQIAFRRANPGGDDVISRCLRLQQAGQAGFSDAQIRTMVGGCLIALPQVPMLIPNAVEMLLRRPLALQGAQAASRRNDLSVDRFLFEAVRFDPLAPGIYRVATQDAVIAAGTPRERRIPAGSKVLAAFASAMRDGRRVACPEVFDNSRPDWDYINFGYGLHRCFAETINRRVLPAMLQALLQNPIHRARGPAGHLSKNFVFADSLTVQWRV